MIGSRTQGNGNGVVGHDALLWILVKKEDSLCGVREGALFVFECGCGGRKENRGRQRELREILGDGRHGPWSEKKKREKAEERETGRTGGEGFVGS